MQKTSIEPIRLEGVQETLIFPLWARAKESQKPNPVLVDPQAVALVGVLGVDTAHMDKKLGEYYQLTWAIRARLLEDEIKAFLVRHPTATVVNIGAGLDTTFERVDNGTVEWYDLDLPDVIEVRRKLIPETQRSRCIGKSVFDASWFDDIGKPKDGLLFVACGVFSYFTGKQVRQLFSLLADRFPHAEIVFDTASRFFVWAGKWLLHWWTGMDIQSYMKWGVDSAREIVRWDARLRLVEEYPFFSRLPLDPSWSKSTVNAMRRADRARGFNIVHLCFLPTGRV